MEDEFIDGASVFALWRDIEIYGIFLGKAAPKYRASDEVADGIHKEHWWRPGEVGSFVNKTSREASSNLTGTKIRTSEIPHGYPLDSILCVSVSWTGTKLCS